MHFYFVDSYRFLGHMLALIDLAGNLTLQGIGRERMQDNQMAIHAMIQGMLKL